MYCINFETLCAENDNVKTIYKGTLEDFHKSHTAEIWMKITSINWSNQKVKFKSLILFHNDFEKSYNKWFQSFRIAPMTAIMCCSCGRKPEEPGGNPPVWHGKRCLLYHCASRNEKCLLAKGVKHTCHCQKMVAEELWKMLKSRH